MPASMRPREPRDSDHEQWLAQFLADAERLQTEDVNAEPDAW